LPTQFPQNEINISLNPSQPNLPQLAIDVNFAPAPITAGEYVGWCAEHGVAIFPGTYDGEVFSSCDPNINNDLQNELGAGNYNWPAVNYILNHKGSNPPDVVQGAIWFFVGTPDNNPASSTYSGAPVTGSGNPLTQDAVNNYAAWAAAGHPKCGDVVAAILLFDNGAGVGVKGDLQMLLIEVPCTCAPCDGQIGDYVWSDNNGNGCQDSNEPGIPGVQVDLYQGTCGGTLTHLATTFTDSTGHYLFSNLCPGDYTVSFTSPAGYTHTVFNASTCGTAPGMPPDRNELNSKCNCTGVSSPCNVCVTLTTANPNNLNVDCGYIPPCTGQIGDYVWSDNNGNGCQDAGEPGIPGVQVDLYQGTCGGTLTHVATTMTDSTGHYLFSGLCPGNYTVSFTSPAGYTHTVFNASTCGTAPNQPPDRNELNSKCNCTGVSSPCNVCVTLTTANPNDLNVDCGYVPCDGQIGDFVWFDANGNGCQDAGETGIANLEVDLYAGCGATGKPIMTTTTDKNGHYLFTGLCVGTYTVGFNTPAGFTRTEPNVGCKDTTKPPYTADRDSKCNCASGTPCGVCVNLTPDSRINLNIDCGYVKLPDVLCAASTGQVGVPYSSSVVAQNGCEPYVKYAIIGGSLPPGLTLNPTTGVISGIPTAGGSYPYIVQVTDSCGNKADTTSENCGITITVCDPCAPHDIQYNFNGTQIIFQSTPGGSYVWFISDGKVSGLPSNKKVVLHISSQSITIPATGSSPQYIVPVPDAFITFDPAATLATTTFDTVNNVWRMTFPPSGMSGNIFYGGAAFKVPAAGLPGGIKNVDWKGTFTTDTAGLSVNWQWSAANYANFTSDYNSIAAKPTDDNQASAYKNSDHAGTPEGTDPSTMKGWKNNVVGGASGGGGGNYTGSGSSTISFKPCVCPNP
jgi:hypothetical protein